MIHALQYGKILAVSIVQLAARFLFLTTLSPQVREWLQVAV
jgi:hypothetical protein